MKDISIVFCADENTKDNIKEKIGNLSKKGFLKDFIFIDSFKNYEYKASECIDGTYIDLPNLKKKLSNIELDFIRVVALTSPNLKSIDIDHFKQYLNLPMNIRLSFLNIIIPTTSWHKNKELLSGTHLANANILISPVDRPNPLRVPVDIDSSNYDFFAAINLISIASLWRGMDDGPFDQEELNRMGEADYIVSRNFVRLLLGPDPVDGLIDSLTTTDGKWITPNKDYEYPSNDNFLLADFAQKIISKFHNSFNFIESREKDSTKQISFIDYFRRRYSDINFDQPLPMLATKRDTLDQLNNILNEFDNEDITSDKKKYEEVNQLVSVILSSMSLRGNTNLPNLWRDIRSIVFSLLDGSDLPKEYSQYKQKIIINNVNSIVSNNETETIENSEIEPTDEDIDLEDLPTSNTTFFDNFTKKLFEQSKLALASIQNTITEILEVTAPDETIKNLYKRLQKRTKFIDRVLVIFLLNVIIYIVNQILVNGGFVNILISIPLLDSITPRRIAIASILLVAYWFYVLFKLFNTFNKLNKNSNVNLNKLGSSAKQFVEFNTLLEQFTLWKEIYRLLIHGSLSKRNLKLELDDSYVDFAPLLSIKGAIGSIQRNIIEEIQTSIVKVGWFYDIYREIEKGFKKYSVNKILRADDNILDQIDSENTGLSDVNSVRYLFLKYFQDGSSNNTLKMYIQNNVEKIIDKTDSDELFSEILNSGKSLEKFLKETEPTENPAEFRFDQNIWSNVAKVFEVQQVDRLKREEDGATLFSLKSGSPIQRVIVRTDTSERVEKRLIINKQPSFGLEETLELNSDLEDPEDF